MTYRVREVFDSIQGEGVRAGTRAVFVRFSGCNLWDGDPAHRSQGKGSCAAWCDTDFRQGQEVTLEGLVTWVERLWPDDGGIRWVIRWVILTGGEPLLQADRPLFDALHERRWKVAVETNGTLDPKLQREWVGIPLLALADWVSVSPKIGAGLAVLGGLASSELKVVLPGGDPGWTPDSLDRLAATTRFGHYVVQPQHGHPDGVPRCLAWVRSRPIWRLSLQLHELLGLP